MLPLQDTLTQYLLAGGTGIVVAHNQMAQGETQKWENVKTSLI